MICSGCKTVVGYLDDGTDEPHETCENLGCRRVYCADCADSSLGFYCEECGQEICERCAQSPYELPHDLEDERTAVVLLCTICFEER